MSAQTVQQIPAEDFGPIIDGHAWWIVDNRRIDVSTMATGPNSEFVDSPDGITPFHVNGHTFTVELPCRHCWHWELEHNGDACCECGVPQSDKPGERWGETGTRQHRLSIVPGMILPIVDRPSGPRADGSSHIRDDGPGYQPRNRWVLMLERRMGDYITLPSGARPSRWAVQCKVAS
jgi:hypothetical protein